MTPYFNNNEAWAAYEAVLLSWLGTPYRHMQGCKGRGADCTLFFAQSLIEAKILLKVDYDYYPRDWHIHTHEELVLTSIYSNMNEHTRPGLRLIEQALNTPLMRGDIVCFRISHTGVTNHAGIMLGADEFIHAGSASGVTRQLMDERYQGYFSTMFRFFKEV